MKLVLMGFLTLDGVSQSPGGPEEDPSGGFTDGGWFAPFVDDEYMAQIVDWMSRADAFLLGRHTYRIFADFWPKVTDPADPIAARINGKPKYVASTTLESADWAHTTVLSDDVPKQVEQLKAQPGEEIQIHGSATLARSLLAAGLIDELRLTVAPVLLGRGRRLFADGTVPTGLKLVDSRVTTAGLMVGTYRPTGAPTLGNLAVLPE